MMDKSAELKQFREHVQDSINKAYNQYCQGKTNTVFVELTVDGRTLKLPLDPDIYGSVDDFVNDLQQNII